MAFEIGSTNLVIELGIILALLMGWQFTAAEFIGGPLMIVVLALLFRLPLRRPTASRPRAEQAERGLAGSMEGHAAMDMSIQDSGSVWSRLLLPRGVHVGVSHVFVMEWAADPARHRDRPAHRRRGRRLGPGHPSGSTCS